MTRQGVLLGALMGVVAPIVTAAQSPAASPTPVDPPLTVTGYVTTSYTFATRPRADTIVGRAYDRRHNAFMLNIASLTLERVAATDRASAGFRVEGWVGENAASIKSAGLDLGTNADVWQAYVVLNSPLRNGWYLQFRGGKMATLMGVELGEDVLNPNLSVGYQGAFVEPFTETGAEVSVTGKWANAQVRVSNGWDQVTDINSGKSVMGRIGLTPGGGAVLALLGYAGSEQSGTTANRRTGVEALLTQPLLNGVTVQLQADYGQEPGLRADGGETEWSSAGVWLTVPVARSATLALRGDYLNDRNGARTSGIFGFPSHSGQRVGSATATLNLTSWSHAVLRPEVRYDRSTLLLFDGEAEQLSFGLGLSYIY